MLAGKPVACKSRGSSLRLGLIRLRVPYYMNIKRQYYREDIGLGFQVINKSLAEFPQLFADFNQVLPARFQLVENVSLTSVVLIVPCRNN